MPKETILVVEDDIDIIRLIEYHLKEADFDFISVLNGPDAVSAAKSKRPDLIILDIMLPLMDGLEVCKALKTDSSTAQIPVIILSAKSREVDKVVGLELGADDYVTKPFSPRELIARIKANLRRTKQAPMPETLQRGEIVIDVPKHTVTVSNKNVSLTHTEFKLLQVLAQRPGIVFSRNQILDAVFGPVSAVCDRTVDAHIKSLRKKLGDTGDYIQTVRGAGYRFREI